MFTEESFEVFNVDGLDERMVEIRAHIQPVFKEVLESIKPQVEEAVGRDAFVHIAQHIRRTKNAPESTWSAISLNKRGYKSEPHLQLGIWKDYVFMYISLIDNPKEEKVMADYLLGNIERLNLLPQDFVYSKDHTVPEYYPITDGGVEAAITRFRDVKKGEFEFGRVISSDSDIWSDPQKAKEFVEETYEKLIPIYTELLKAANHI